MAWTKKLKDLPRQGLSNRKATRVKGGKRAALRIAKNHNQALL